MWNLLLNDDQRMIAASVRDFLAAELPIQRLRPQAAAVDSKAVWQGMAALGWFGVGLPEEAGGAGLGLAEEVLIQRDCGRYLVSPSVLATVLAGHLAWHGGDAALAAAVAKGEACAALAIPGDRGQAYAFDWNGRDPLLLWNADGMGLFTASALADARTQNCLDNSVTMHSGDLAIDQPLLWVPATQAPLAHRAEILLAAALVGLAEHACDLAVGYAKLREQFGKPIGSFQAIKHRCADMAVRQRLAWYQTCLAALKLEAGVQDAALQVASAKLLAAEAAHENGRAGVQIHGGIGFQAECDAHWFLKRAFVYDQAGGAMAAQAGRVFAAPAPGW